MSKNHPHDNIYSILGKLEALKPTPQEKHDATVKAIYESVEAQGSILKGLRNIDPIEAKLSKMFAEGKDEGKPGKNFAKIAKSASKEYGSKEAGNRVAGAVRAKLAKQGKLEETAPPGMEKMVRKLKKEYPGHEEKAFATAWSVYNKKHGKKTESREACSGCNECSMEEGEITQKGNVTRHTKTDFPGYPSTEFDQDDAPRGKGRPRIHAKKEPTGKGRGRPTVDTPTYGNKMNDPFGRSPEKAPAGTPGRKIAGKGNEDSAIGGHYGESTIVRKPGSTVHTKTDYPGYPATNFAGDDDAPRGKGRPRIHAQKEPTGLGRGRPATTKMSGPSMSDPFGRTTGAVPKGPKGKVHSMDEGMSRLQARLTESINFKAMAEETNQSIDELMNELQGEIRTYKQTGHCGDKLRDFLEVHAHAKKQSTPSMPPAIPPVPQVADEAIDPTNPRDYEIPAVQRKAQGQAPLTQKDILQKDQKAAHDYHERVHGAKHPDAMEEELNELAKLAGIHESTSFDGSSTPELTINTTLDSDGKKTININAEGPQADMLLQLLKMSGLEAPAQAPTEIDVEGNEFTGKLKDTPKGGNFELGGKEYTDTSELDEEPNEGNEFSGKLAQARAQHADTFDVDGHEYEVKEADAPVAEPTEEPANNAHHNQYASMKASTMNPGEGDFGEKKMFGGRGDNRMSQQPSRPAKPVQSVATLEAKLAAEYESIKKVSK